MAFLNDEEEEALVLDVPTIDANELAELLQSSAAAPDHNGQAMDANGPSLDDASNVGAEGEAWAGGNTQPDADNSGSDDDDEADNDAHDAAVDGDGAPEEGLEAALDDASLVALDKKEAKRLGKKLYKRWKKLHKRLKKTSSKGSGGEKHTKKSSSKTKERRSKQEDKDGGDADEGPHETSGSKRQRKKRGRDDDDGNDDDGYEVAHASSSAPLSNQRAPAPRKERVAAKTKQQGPRLTMEQKQELFLRDAAALVARMRDARVADAFAQRSGQPPLHRIAMMEETALVCRRKYMHQALVAQGILDELSNWLYDANRQELGPQDLRSLALELLLQFDVRGMLQARKEDERFDEEKANVDDLCKYRGICREDLEATSLGLAVNRVRTHTQETQANKVLATQLLQRLSRGFKYRRDDDDDDVPAVEVLWKCKGDPTVAPPFDPVTSASDAFQRRLFQPDPLDPMSYLRMPPPRYQKGYVTNLSHIHVEPRKKVERQ